MKSRSSVPRQLRANATRAERKMWSRLRDRRFLGLKFRRQASIDRFIVDFACMDAKLIVEIDGGQHGEKMAADARRTEILETMGFLVLRFWNNDVLSNIDGVLEFMAATVQPEALEPPSPGAPMRADLSPKGRGRLMAQP